MWATAQIIEIIAQEDGQNIHFNKKNVILSTSL